MFYFCVRSLNILWRFDSRGLLPKKRVPRSKERQFILSLILNNIVATFKKIIYLLVEYWDWIYDLVCWFLSCDEKAHATEWLYKEDSYPSFIHQFNSIKLSLLVFRLMFICEPLFKRVIIRVFETLLFVNLSEAFKQREGSVYWSVSLFLC
jgi:hypothetical protein